MIEFTVIKFRPPGNVQSLLPTVCKIRSDHDAAIDGHMNLDFDFDFALRQGRDVDKILAQPSIIFDKFVSPSNNLILIFST